MALWRNWYTRQFQTLFPPGVSVRVRPGPQKHNIKRNIMNQEYLDIQLDRARAHAMLQIRILSKDGKKEEAMAVADQFSIDMEKYVQDTIKLNPTTKK